jgi:hypothetical protein
LGSASSTPIELEPDGEINSGWDFNAGIAELAPQTDHILTITGLAPGETKMYIFSDKGDRIYSATLNVTPENGHIVRIYGGATERPGGRRQGLCRQADQLSDRRAALNELSLVIGIEAKALPSTPLIWRGKENPTQSPRQAILGIAGGGLSNRRMNARLMSISIAVRGVASEPRKGLRVG